MEDSDKQDTWDMEYSREFPDKETIRQHIRGRTRGDGTAMRHYLELVATEEDLKKPRMWVYGKFGTEYIEEIP
jgi:hypothetical protein